MANKRAKSGSGTAAPVGSKGWEAGLTAALFDEDSWRADVSLVVGENEMCVSAFKQAVQLPLRRLFTLLSWEETLEKINELGNPKAKKTKDVPAFFEVMELAKSVLDAGEELCVDLTAKLVKFQLLTIKSNDLQRRDALQRGAEEKAKIKAGPGVAKEKSVPPGKGSAKGEKGKKASEPPPQSKETKLKRRGEEDDTDKYIDDEPDEGPQHYILMTGFYQPCLISALDSLGVHVSNVIRLSSDRPERSDPSQGLTARDTSLSVAEQQNGVAPSVGEKQALHEFWNQLDRVLTSGAVGSRLWDVARLNHLVDPTLLPPDPGCTEAMQALGMAVFEGVACLLYDSLEWRRQHQHYLNSMRLVPVPVVGGAELSGPPKGPAQAPQTQAPQITKKKPVAKESPEAQRAVGPDPTVLSTEVDMRVYWDLLDTLPLQAVSVPVILHCILEQVVASEQEVTGGPADSEQRSDWPEQELITYMLSSVLSLPHSEQDRKKLMEEFVMREDYQPKSEQRQPTLLYHHDQRARRLLHLPVSNGLDVISVETAMMERDVVWSSLMSTHTPPTSSSMARKYELLHHCSDDSLSCSAVQRLLHLCVFESMHLTVTDPNDHLARPVLEALTPLPWNDPIAYAQHLYRCLNRTPGSSEGSFAGCEDQMVEIKVSAEHLQKSLTRHLRDWNFTEHHSPDIFPQVLKTACEAYRCMDVFHSSINNVIFLVCHNPMSPERCSRESWDVALHTDVRFRDYLEHVAPSLSEWTQQEEQKRQQKEVERRSLVTVTPEAPVVSADQENAELHIRQGSLKAWRLEQQQLKEEELSRSTKKEVKGKPPAKGGDKGGGKGSDRANSTRESRKDHSPIKGESKTPESAKPTEGDVDIPQENTHGLIGYSLNGRLVQIKGECQYLYPTDGGQISVDRVHFIQGSTQVKVCVKKDGHCFYTYVSEQQRQESSGADMQGEMGKCVCFYGVLHNGIQLSYSYMPQITEDANSETEAMETGTTETGAIPHPHAQQVEECGYSAPLRLHVSLPTGLQLSFGFEETEGGQAVLVRQLAPPAGHGYPTPLLSTHTELSRTITCLGTVIKYMRDGSTEVLFADGTVSRSPDSGPVCVVVSSSAPQDERDTPPESKDRKGKVSSKSTMGPDLTEALKEPHQLPLEVVGGSWTTTTPSGLRVASHGGRPREVLPILTYHATDPFSQSVVITREDRVQSVLEADGTTVVDHADGTRITTFYQQRMLLQQQSSGPWQPGCLESAVRTSSTPAQSASVRPSRRNSAVGSLCPAGVSTECSTEKLVRVESGGITAVTVNCDRRSCDVLFGDGTVITASCHGTYRVRPSGAGELLIHKDGLALYSSNPDGLLPEGDQAGQYVMGHCAGDLCLFTDPDGNLYQVTDDGQVSIRRPREPGRNIDRELERDSERDPERDLERDPERHLERDPERHLERDPERHLERDPESGVQASDTPLGFDTHPPRLFVVGQDGSGTEWLSAQSVEEFLKEADSDPAVTVIREPLPDPPDTSGITVLRAFTADASANWVLPKQQDDLIPPNLKSRKWDTFPACEQKRPVAPTGSVQGGVSERATTQLGLDPNTLQNPAALLARQIIQHPPGTHRVRTKLQEKILVYTEQLMQKEKMKDEMQVKEPRTVQERVQQNQLLQLVLSLPDSEHHPVTMETRPLSGAGFAPLVSLHSQAVMSLHPTSEQQDQEQSEQLCGVGAGWSDLAQKQESLWRSRINKHRLDLQEERRCRHALRNHIITPYFHPELQEMPLFTHQELDLATLCLDLPPFGEVKDCESESSSAGSH